MRTAIACNRIISRKLQRHAAWIPTVSPFALGDYGVFERGVFSRLGNIKDLGVDFDTLPGGTASLKFDTSSGVEVTLSVDGQGNVPQLPGTDVQAKAEFKYKRARSFLVRALKLTSNAIQDIPAATSRLARHPRWRLRYKLITELLTTDAATIIATASRNSTVVVEGKANVLQQFIDGKVGAGVTVKSSSELGLEIEGEAGAIAFKLVRARRNGRVGLESAGEAPDAPFDDDFDDEPNDEDHEVDDDL